MQTLESITHRSAPKMIQSQKMEIEIQSQKIEISSEIENSMGKIRSIERDKRNLPDGCWRSQCACCGHCGLEFVNGKLRTQGREKGEPSTFILTMDVIR